MWLVELARIAGRDAVVPAIATMLGVPDLPGTPPRDESGLERLSGFFSAKDALLVLDNCEHVVADVAPLVEEILGSCPRLMVLTTTREPLAVPGERLWPANPLAPQAAIALFAARASAVMLGFISELRGEPAAAERLHREALAQALHVEDPQAIAQCLEGLAGVALVNGQGSRAASLLGAAARRRGGPGVAARALTQMVGTLRAGATGILDNPIDSARIHATVRERLDPLEFDRAFQTGATASSGDIALL